MTFDPCPNIAEVALQYSDNTQTAVNVYHCHSDSGWDTPKLITLAGLFKSWETATAAHYRSSAVFLFNIHVRDLTTETSLSFDVPVSPVVAGLRDSPIFPNNVTVAVKAQTGFAGRSFRGRTYWIGLCEDQAGGSHMVPGSLADIVTGLNTLLAAVNGLAGVQMVVLSRRSGGAPRVPGIGTPILSYLAVDTNTDSQRRRLPAHNVHH